MGDDDATQSAADADRRAVGEPGLVDECVRGWAGPDPDPGRFCHTHPGPDLHAGGRGPHVRAGTSCAHAAAQPHADSQPTLSHSPGDGHPLAGVRCSCTITHPLAGDHRSCTITHSQPSRVAPAYPHQRQLSGAGHAPAFCGPAHHRRAHGLPAVRSGELSTQSQSQ